MKYIIYILFLTSYLNLYCQDIFHQDVFKGGVTWGGFSTGLGVGSGNLQLYVEPGSIIKKVYLFAFSSGENTTGDI